MKNYLKALVILMAIPVLILMEGCQKSDELVMGSNPIVNSPGIKTYLGPSILIGMGTSQAWVAVDNSGVPNAVGINLSERF